MLGQFAGDAPHSEAARLVVNNTTHRYLTRQKQRWGLGHQPNRGYNEREGQGVDHSPDIEVPEALCSVPGVKARATVAIAQQKAMCSQGGADDIEYLFSVRI